MTSLDACASQLRGCLEPDVYELFHRKLTEHALKKDPKFLWCCHVRVVVKQSRDEASSFHFQWQNQMESRIWTFSLTGRLAFVAACFHSCPTTAHCSQVSLLQCCVPRGVLTWMKYCTYLSFLSRTVAVLVNVFCRCYVLQCDSGFINEGNQLKVTCLSCGKSFCAKCKKTVSDGTHTHGGGRLVSSFGYADRWIPSVCVVSGSLSTRI